VSTLLAWFLDTNAPIEQKFKIKDSLLIYAIRIHLYKDAVLNSGLLTATILLDSNSLYSKQWTYLELQTLIGGQYAHGYLSWQLENFLSGRIDGQARIEYTIRLEWSGPNNKIAWAREYEDPFITSYGNNLNEDAYRPYDIEIWEAT